MATQGIGRPWRAGLAAVLVIACVAIAFGVVRRRSAGAGDEGDAPVFVVRRGPLTISIAQSGTIQAMEQDIITSEVEGQTTIIYLVEEGSRVQEGDLLVELDASALQDKLVEQQIRVQNAEAAYIRAREGLAVTKNKAESDIALAELNYRFAKEDLTQYKEGSYKQDLMAAESKITLAEEELQVSKRKLEWSEKLFAEAYVSQAERDADRLSYNRANLDLDLARGAKQLLEDFTYKRELAQRESDVDQTKQALERARLEASANIVQAEADLKAKEAEWKQQQGKEEKIGKQIEKTKIRAPREGLVVYATSAQFSWRGNQEPLEAGQTVRERQELIYLPTAEEMMAVVQIHESDLDKIRLGLPAVVTVDALQSRRFRGTVQRIAPLPDARSMWMNPDLKVYDTEVRIEGRNPELRTGMSCMAEIVVERYEDAVYVPVQAVVRVNGVPTVYRREDGSSKPVAVELGLDNNRMVHVLSGLEAGQQVLLAPPLNEAAVPHEGGVSAVGANAKASAGVVTNATEPAVSAPAPVAEPAPVTGAGGAEEGRARPELSAEQRAELRKRLEAMTPEQRREAIQKMSGGRRRGGRDDTGGGER